MRGLPATRAAQLAATMTWAWRLQPSHSELRLTPHAPDLANRRASRVSHAHCSLLSSDGAHAVLAKRVTRAPLERHDKLPVIAPNARGSVIDEDPG